MAENLGLKVGSNIVTNSDKDLNFTSKYSTLKFYKWASAQFTTNGSGNGSVVIPHGLTYAPIVRVFRKITPSWSSGGISLGTGSANSFCEISSINWYAGGLHNANIVHYTDDTNITIEGVGIGASTTYYFRYYILVDLSKSYSGNSAIVLNKNMGFKVSKTYKNVLTAKEYDMDYSSKYKAVQYYPSHIKETTLTLPIMFASRGDTFVDEGTYVDFNHSFNYPPFFESYYGDSPITELTSIPYHLIPFSNPTYSINGFSDSTKVRIYFWRGSTYSGGTVFGNWTTSETITIKVIMFSENLLGSENP